MEVFRLLDYVERYVGTYHDEVAALYLIFLQSDLDGGCTPHADSRNYRIAFKVLSVEVEEFEVSFYSAVIVVDRYVHSLKFVLIYQKYDRSDRNNLKNDGFVC